MGLEQVKNLLKQKENIRLEFKKARNKLPFNIFDSIIAMLNRDGGDILIGINENGELIGVDSEYVDEMVSQVVNHITPPQFIEGDVFSLINS